MGPGPAWSLPNPGLGHWEGGQDTGGEGPGQRGGAVLTAWV